MFGFLKKNLGLGSKRESSPLVSVVLASYNHAEYVAEAVRSVLDQTYQNIELIVIDDGSDDGTPDVVAGITDPRLQLIRLQENRRRHPRALGVSLARGKYLAFQNSDDIWLPDKLEKQVEWMRGHALCQVCFSDVALIDEQGFPLYNCWLSGVFTTTNRPGATWLRHFFEVGNCLCLPSALVRHESLAAIGGFHQSLVQLSDLDLWVRLAARGDLHILDEKLTAMRIVEGRNLSVPSDATHRRSLIESEQVYRNYLDETVLGRLGEIFPQIHLPPEAANSCRKAALALHAMNIGTSAHLRFADDVLETLLDSSASRAEVTGCFGADIVRKFLNNRTRTETLIHAS